MRFGYKTVSQMKVTARSAASSEAAIYESSDNTGYSFSSNNINTSTVIKRSVVSPGATSTNIVYTAYVPPGPVSYNASILVVAGGASGAGGSSSSQGGGGGGAGGLIYAASVPMIKGCCQYTVCVGAAGGTPSTVKNDGLNGSSSCFGTLISTVGGGGGGAVGHCALAGCSGGSGGGGYPSGSGYNLLQYCFTGGGGGGTPGQGFRGMGGGGGGGAGGTGIDTCPNTPSASVANGGDGLCYFGNYYAGGGASGQQCTTPTYISGNCAGIGGLGGGGGGGAGGAGGTAPANTGGGGGGGSGCVAPAGTFGGGGGSGIVIVGYAAPAVIGSGGSITCSSVTCNGITCCYWCHVYTTSGCYCS